MRERLYTIPVNEAFEHSHEQGGCPFCVLFRRLEEEELDLILGASMMEPDVRIITNKKGFCPTHYAKMFPRKNRLGLALMLESHLDELQKQIKSGAILTKDKGAKSVARIAALEESCYVCDRIEDKLSKMFQTALLLFSEEPEFRKKFAEAPLLCLTHYRRVLEMGKACLKRDVYDLLVKTAGGIVEGYLKSLGADISWFCKKFDYRYDSEPWGNAKDSVERAIQFLSGPVDLP